MDDDVQAVLGGLVVQWLGRRTCDQQIAAVHCWVSTWMGDRVCAGKPAWYVTCNPAFYPSVVGKSSTSLSGWGYSGVCSLVLGGR